MRNVPAIDATGLHVIEDILDSSNKAGTNVLFSGVHAQPLMAFTNSGLLKKIGEQNIFSNIDEALKTSDKLIKEQII
jgi:SulP family sulfate permease